MEWRRDRWRGGGIDRVEEEDMEWRDDRVGETV